ncbi:sulfurtransferase [Aquimarina intermedia]|uniref:Sulfurtransferase n=1 Tax=Aquimarina intermedia TaxID=350814 RepID=A0A5S5CAX6_9FLAO|nr:sulfurtransferase [Aquimarina intermedia]TYP76299.1 thiosulfate/3-mercaptopyruvate sulfurtransferase [Aquimarina intermedia]
MSSTQNIPELVDDVWLSQHLDDPHLILLDASIKNVMDQENSNKNYAILPKAQFFDLKKVFSDQSVSLPNMVPLPRNFEKACRALGISKSSKVVIYDTKGIYSSPRAWFLFKIMGFDNVAILDGGLPAWLQAGRRTTNQYQITNKEQGSFKARFRPELVVNAEEVLNAINGPHKLIIDARSHGRFTGTEPEPRADLKAGHIPGSINIPYTELLKNGKFIDQVSLKSVLNTLNLNNKHLIFTCGSGITACILKFAFEQSGYQNASVYDGSWTEWGQLSNAPIAL